MAKNFAITIGINKYEYIRSLKYAATDAEKVRDFLLTEAGFNQVFYYSDHSPSINNVPTRPTRSSLLRLLKLTFEKEFMGAGDNFWFFFSGHGARVKGVDYIIPSDTFAEDIESSAISVNYIIQRLQRCGADNVVLILDACREQGDDLSKSITGMGEQTEREAREKGVISICSCSPNEYSWELEELQQGAFTYALLEGLGSKGKKATVERLNEYLKYRVKELAQHKGQQTPRVMADPIEKSHLILMPKYATKSDVSTLKNYAYKAQTNRNFEQAERLWIRVLETGVDMDAVQALQQIAIEKVGHSSPLPKSDNSENKSSELPKAVDKPPKPLPEVELKSDVGYDYTNLKKLLSEGKWREADEETARCLLQVAGRQEESWLRVEDIEKFPCTDLGTIDQLWIKYSNGKFGFSVQKEILGGTRKYNEEVWQAFGNKVGWFQGGKWLYYFDLTFSLDTDYMGHLPKKAGTLGGVKGIFSLLSRRDL
ncbi:MAG: GUN4 domain-containing protein [Cyanobacteria bacterium P01_H01_bin.35]